MHISGRKLEAGAVAGGPKWDGKLREAVTRLDQAFRLSYGLSYEWKAVAAARMQVPDLSGEPPGTRTQSPRLKSTDTGEENQRDHSSESSDA